MSREAEHARQLAYIERELERGDREPADVRLLTERAEAIRRVYGKREGRRGLAPTARL